MKDDAALEYGPAVEAVARAMFNRVLETYPSLFRDKAAQFDDLTDMQKFSYREDALVFVQAAAPYFAAQGWEIGYGNGDGDSRIVGGDYYENPWGDYVQDEG